MDKKGNMDKTIFIGAHLRRRAHISGVGDDKYEVPGQTHSLVGDDIEAATIALAILEVR